MAIDAKHPLHSKYARRWRKIRHVVAGSSAVKDAGVEFLPKLGGQDQTDYESYKTRALFMPATGRTLEGLIGLMLRVPPVVAASKETEEAFVDHCTTKRRSLTSFTRILSRETLQMGRAAILVDMPADAPAASVPWLAVYQAENIINWRYIMSKDGQEILQRIVLEEEVEVMKTDAPDEVEQTCQLRELSLQGYNTETGDDSQASVAVTIYQKVKGTNGAETWAAIGPPTVLTASGRALRRIPIVIIDLTDEDGALTPPLEAITDVNLSHYLSSADLEHGRHFTALPTPWVTGAKPDQTLKIGSQTAWMIEDPTARVGMLEFTGQGLAALETALEQKQQMMAILGARMLEEQKKAVEATQTHQIRKGGEEGVLAQISMAVEDALNTAFAICSEWAPTLGKVEVELNREFGVQSLTAQELTAYVAAMQSKAISFHTFFNVLKAANVYPEDTTEETETAQIETDNERAANMDAARLAAMPTPEPAPTEAKPAFTDTGA